MERIMRAINRAAPIEGVAIHYIFEVPYVSVHLKRELSSTSVRGFLIKLAAELRKENLRPYSPAPHENRTVSFDSLLARHESEPHYFVIQPTTKNKKEIVVSSSVLWRMSRQQLATLGKSLKTLLVN